MLQHPKMHNGVTTNNVTSKQPNAPNISFGDKSGEFGGHGSSGM